MSINEQILPLNRRNLLKILGASTLLPRHLWAGHPTISGLPANFVDDVSTVPGLDWEVLIKFGDTINPQGDQFGFNNDLLATIDIDKKTKGLWVNHETSPPHLMKRNKGDKISVQQQKAAVGGSYVQLVQENGRWQKTIHPRNFRVDAKTMIPFTQKAKIKGSSKAMGTLANCSGGKTPWNTFLTCEENFDKYYGTVEHLSPGTFRELPHKDLYGWKKDSAQPSEHYGWVTEVNPVTQECKKHVALGRFAHEGARVIQAGRHNVVYMGDDKKNQCIYKFISKNKNSLDEGELFVADLNKGEWKSLDYSKSKLLQKEFSSPLEALIFTRKAARIVGGTPTHRPEGIDINPNDGSVLVSLTNNTEKGLPHGLLLKIDEKNKDHLSTTFTSSTYLAGGKKNGFSHPDNIAFDPKGNLWFVTDVPGSKIGRPGFVEFGHNALFLVPKQTGQIIRVATAPSGAEFCSPCFLDDGATMLLSVQHPGENPPKGKSYSSNWPDGGSNHPTPAVILLKGEFLENLG